MVTFDVPADAYGRFMGRFSEPLAVPFADAAELVAGQRVLDVGCGPGALTTELVRRLGETSVAAVDPSAPFVAAVRQRLPEVDVHQASAEQLPFPDDSFDAALAQLVVHFMADPVTGLAEMRRVTRPGGRLLACVWDHAGEAGPLSIFMRAALDLDPAAPHELDRAGVREGHLVELANTAGWHEVEQDRLSVTVGFASVEEWWEPYTLGVGPLGGYVRALSPAHRDALREHCAELLPTPPFSIDAAAWSVRARA